MPYLRGTAYNNQSSRYANSQVATKSDVLRLYRQVKVSRPALKYHDNAISFGSLAAGAVSAFLINDIDQGTKQDERVGSMVKICRIQMRGRPFSAAGSYALPTIHVLQAYSSSFPSTLDFGTQPGGFSDPRKYKEVYNFYPFSKGYACTLHADKRLKYPIKTTYDGSTGASFVRNALYCVVNNPAAGQSQSVNFSVRIWYYDV